MSAVTAASDDEPKALELATKLAAMQSIDFDDVFMKSAAELRRQHAEIERLRAENKGLKQLIAQWTHDRYVAVDRGALNMVINVLRRDEASGMRIRGEMADLLSAAPTQRVPDGWATAVLMNAINDYARLASLHYVETLYGTSKSYTEDCRRRADEAQSKIAAMLSAAPAQPEQPAAPSHRPPPEWYAQKIQETLDDDFVIGPAHPAPPAGTPAAFPWPEFHARMAESKPATPLSVPTLNQVARRKLQDLLADGHQVAGVMIERQNADGTVTRGAVGAGGLVIWWPPQNNPLAEIAVLASLLSKTTEVCRNVLESEDFEDGGAELRALVQAADRAVRHITQGKAVAA